MTNQQDIKIMGFAPDLDITTPGAIINSGISQSFIPTVKGIAGVKGMLSAGFPALAATCRGAVVVRKIDDTTRFIIGTRTKLYEGSGMSYTDVSKSGGTYTGGSENLWRFTQFGNDTIATNRIDPMQVSAGSGAFGDLGGSPPLASIVETCNGFVLAFDYNDGTNDYPDGWWCSALQNDASWSPSIATQAANGRLLDSSGKIFAAKRLGDNMVAYKAKSMYLGFNDGPPVIWRWQLVPGDIGCVSQEAVQSVIINDVPCHVFAGFDGFYIFDGSRPRQVGIELKDWYNNNVPAQYRYRIKSLKDPIASNVYFYLPDSTGALTSVVIINYRTERWGYISRGNLDMITSLDAAVSYVSGGATYDTLGDFYSTYDSLPDISYDSPFFTSSAEIPAIIGNDKILYTYTGGTKYSQFQMNYTGDMGSYNTLNRIRPRFNSYPTSATVKLNVTPDIGSNPTLKDNGGSGYPLNDNKFDMQISSRFFSPIFNIPANYEMIGYSLYSEQDGEE